MLLTTHTAGHVQKRVAPVLLNAGKWQEQNNVNNCFSV